MCGGRGETLFFGLGNRRITPDCVGALTADRVFATRHIKRLAKGLDTDELGDSAVVAAGVMHVLLPHKKEPRNFVNRVNLQ